MSENSDVRIMALEKELSELRKREYQPTDVDGLLSYWREEDKLVNTIKAMKEFLKISPINIFPKNNDAKSVDDGEPTPSLDTILELFGRAEEGEGE